MINRLASGALVPPLSALWRGGCRTHRAAGLGEGATSQQWLKGLHAQQQDYPGSIASSWQWLCSKPPKGFEKYFKKNERSPGPAEEAHETKDRPDPKDLCPGGDGGRGGGGSKRGGKKEGSEWWRRMQAEPSLRPTAQPLEWWTSVLSVRACPGAQVVGT
ncbi:mitochondrial inner membrane m-AAA protease component AFG3L1-like [Emydura macquarii macquarii]|uniref:mitochondrial inner membrane m-AAA protease component AFG3L1-like n=1 Tax=Emydura macquarii macquarii TaxID=1129001 RepID=UPI00352ADDD8